MSPQPVRSFRDLEAWQSAMLVAVVAHTIADRFPAVQRFALGAQIRRAATSIPSNVAEGHAHRGRRIYLHHVRIALGSLAELDTQVELALRLNLIDRQQLHDITSELARCGQLLHGLERALANRTIGVTTVAMLIAPAVVWWLIGVLIFTNRWY